MWFVKGDEAERWLVFIQGVFADLLNSEVRKTNKKWQRKKWLCFRQTTDLRNPNRIERCVNILTASFVLQLQHSRVNSKSTESWTEGECFERLLALNAVAVVCCPWKGLLHHYSSHWFSRIDIHSASYSDKWCSARAANVCLNWFPPRTSSL